MLRRLALDVRRCIIEAPAGRLGHIYVGDKVEIREGVVIRRAHRCFDIYFSSGPIRPGVWELS